MCVYSVGKFTIVSRETHDTYDNVDFTKKGVNNLVSRETKGEESQHKKYTAQNSTPKDVWSLFLGQRTHHDDDARRQRCTTGQRTDTTVRRMPWWERDGAQTLRGMMEESVRGR
jgi:hypothetical protein